MFGPCDGFILAVLFVFAWLVLRPLVNGFSPTPPKGTTAGCSE